MIKTERCKMIVAELIKELSKYKKDLPVHLAYDNGTGGEVIRIFRDGDIDDSLIVYLSEDEEV